MDGRLEHIFMAGYPTTLCEIWTTSQKKDVKKGLQVLWVYRRFKKISGQWKLQIQN